MMLIKKNLAFVGLNLFLLSCSSLSDPEDSDFSAEQKDYNLIALSEADKRCDVCDLYSYTRFNTQKDIMFTDDEIASMIGWNKVQEFKDKMTKEPQAEYALTLEDPELLDDGSIRGTMLMVVSDRLIGNVFYKGVFLRTFNQGEDGIIKFESYSSQHNGEFKSMSTLRNANVVAFTLVENGIRIRDITIDFPLSIDGAYFIGNSKDKWAINNKTYANRVRSAIDDELLDESRGSDSYAEEYSMEADATFQNDLDHDEDVEEGSFNGKSEVILESLESVDNNSIRELSDEYIPPQVVAAPKMEEIYTRVEQMPKFGSGERELLEYIAKSLKYPAEARENGIQGTVVVQFVVDQVGRITAPKVVREVGGGCDEEALRVIKSMPPWIPGKQQGKPVKVRYTLPIKFKLED